MFKPVSIPHWDAIEDNSLFYNYISNKVKVGNVEELRDIYFGGGFISSSNIRYNNVMGCTPSKEQYLNLLKIQEDFGVEISLTLNDSNIPPEITLDSKCLEEFIKYIGKFYADGVRSCTISYTHLMRQGILQDTFPDMRWKNTVNQGVKSTQEVIDYNTLGYNTVLLDRCLNRDLEEINKIYEQQKPSGYLEGVETSLLISENCMPSCTFKAEHDSWNNNVDYNKSGGYSEHMAHHTCINWKQLNIPRFTTNVELYSVEDYEAYAVDVFKLSGRRAYRTAVPYEGLVIQVAGKNLIIESIKELLYNKVPYISVWLNEGLNNYKDINYPNVYNIQEIKDILINEPIRPKNYSKLVKVLQTCKNQCYDCHACERLYNFPEVNSVLNI